MPIKFIYENNIMNGWQLIHQTLDSILQCQEKVISSYGLTAKQHAVLSAIQYIDGPVTIKDLATCFDRDSSSITFIIDRVEKDELVTRVRDLKDRRSLRLTLTQKGKKMLRKTAKAAYEVSENIMTVLSPQELSTLISLMEKIQERTYEYREVKDQVKVIRVPSMKITKKSF
jgi:DNA-binding MarR family transcriptional regulator